MHEERPDRIFLSINCESFVSGVVQVRISPLGFSALSFPPVPSTKSGMVLSNVWSEYRGDWIGKRIY
jgi:hypothetical protein